MIITELITKSSLDISLLNSVFLSASLIKKMLSAFSIHSEVFKFVLKVILIRKTDYSL